MRVKSFSVCGFSTFLPRAGEIDTKPGMSSTKKKGTTTKKVQVKPQKIDVDSMDEFDAFPTPAPSVASLVRPKPGQKPKPRNNQATKKRGLCCLSSLHSSPSRNSTHFLFSCEACRKRKQSQWRKESQKGQ